MTNQELLTKLDVAHQNTSQAILKLRNLNDNESLFTDLAKQTLNSEILQTVQLVISELEVISSELEGVI